MSASKLEPDAAPADLELRLYVAGDSPNSVRALANLRAAMSVLGRSPDFEIVDVLRSPERGLRDNVLVTPMLVRISPPPERRILGNLSERTILIGLIAPEGAGHE